MVCPKADVGYVPLVLDKMVWTRAGLIVIVPVTGAAALTLGLPAWLAVMLQEPAARMWMVAEPLPLSVTVQMELVVPVRLAVSPESASALTEKSGSAKILVAGGLNTSVWPARTMVKEPVPEPDST